MLIPIGTKVKLLHSNDTGIVLEWLDENMLRVKLEHTGMEIPVFPDTLQIIQLPEQKTKAKLVPGKKVKNWHQVKWDTPEQQYILIKDHGIQLAFDPVHYSSGQLQHYSVYLLNTTPNDLLYEVQLSLKNMPPQDESGKLSARSAHQIGTLNWDALNDSPTYKIYCQRVSTQGTDDGLEHILKIKPNQFFKPSRDHIAPILNKRVKLYKIFESLTPAPKTKKEDLKSYTKRNLTYQSSNLASNSGLHRINLAEIANFPTEIDLHIESLVGKNTKIPPKECLGIQLNHFEAYLSKAILLNIDRIFVIHGIGTGVLKKEIGKILAKTPQVKSYKNDFHPKYNFGATEVIFK